MTITIPADVVMALRRHAERGYPREVCGFLLGMPGAGYDVRALLPAENLRADTRTRYLIDGDAYRAAERETAARGLEIVGFYHSHPDAPARPSEFDLEHGWPSVAYLIIAVTPAGAGAVTGWVLTDDRMRFAPLTVDILDPIPETACGGY